MIDIEVLQDYLKLQLHITENCKAESLEGIKSNYISKNQEIENISLLNNF